jgi:4-hydroxybenzoate polyprenyltransferase
MLSHSLASFAKDIKISHSIFALPFVVVGMLIGVRALPTDRQIFLLIVCMISARSFAMGMNRYLDRDIDALNPRTVLRAISRGALSPQQCLTISIVFAVLFVTSAFMLSPLAGMLSFPLLGVLALYSKMKRWTLLTHWYLGLCLGLAPVAAQIAMTGGVTVPVVGLCFAILFWVAGFDLLYSTQDAQFDRTHGLNSFPSRFGIKATLVTAGLCFLTMIALLIGIGLTPSVGVGFWYFLGTFFVFSILCFELWLVSDAWKLGFSKRINAAFFNANAVVSLIFMLFCLLDFI